jgi:hypothetical protein
MMSKPDEEASAVQPRVTRQRKHQSSLVPVQEKQQKQRQSIPVPVQEKQKKVSKTSALYLINIK